MKCFLFSLLLLILESNPSFSCPKITRVFILFRHGHRFPLGFYPTHPNYGQSPEQFKYGKLSPIGDHQALQLGDRLRMYYTSRGFPDIRLHHADALSSQTERTVNSGNIFYREFVRDRSAEIAIRDVQSDYSIAQFGRCKRYETAYLNISKEMPLEYKALLQLHGSVLSNMQQRADIPMGNIRNAAFLYDVIWSEKAFGNDLPKWADNVYPKGMELLMGANYRLLTQTPFMLKQKSGTLISDIRNFLTKRGGAPFLIYSGHDTTMISLARALKLESQLPILFNFTAAFAFELYSHDDPATDQIRIRFFDLGKPDYEVFPEDCETTCTKHHFLRITEDLKVDNPSAFCENPLNYVESDEYLEALAHRSHVTTYINEINVPNLKRIWRRIIPKRYVVPMTEWLRERHITEFN